MSGEIFYIETVDLNSADLSEPVDNGKRIGTFTVTWVAKASQGAFPPPFLIS